MARLVENARIYRDVTLLMSLTLDLTKDMPKSYRYSVGQQMQLLTMRMVNEIASAYITKDMKKKIDTLDDFQADFNTFKTFQRICYEKRILQGIGRRAQIIELADSIGKQSTAWKNSYIKLKNQMESNGESL